MNLLLDTHTFIWFVNGDKDISSKAIELIENPDNLSLISIASIWEIAIKASLGKLRLTNEFHTIRDLILENGLQILPITFSHTEKVYTLPFHHRDPFDRIIIAQAIVEKCTVITKDSNFSKYELLVKW